MAELTEGESYLIRITITNQSVRAGAPVEATFEVAVYGDGAIVYFFPSMVTSEYFSAGQTRTLDYPLDVPLGYGGQSGRVWAVVRDPAGVELARASEEITIRPVAPPTFDVDITNARVAASTGIQIINAVEYYAIDVDVTIDNRTGQLISCDAPDYADIEITVMDVNGLWPAGLFYRRFSNRDIPAGLNTLNIAPGPRVRAAYLSIEPGTTDVIVDILVKCAWGGTGHVQFYDRIPNIITA